MAEHIGAAPSYLCSFSLLFCTASLQFACSLLSFCTSLAKRPCRRAKTPWHWRTDRARGQQLILPNVVFSTEGRQIKREIQKAGHHHPEGHMNGDKWRETNKARDPKSRTPPLRRTHEGRHGETNKATDPERRTRPVTHGRTPLKKELRTPTVNCLGKDIYAYIISMFSRYALYA